MIGARTNKKLNVEVKAVTSTAGNGSGGASSSGLTPKEKAQLEKIATLEKEISDIKKGNNTINIGALPNLPVPVCEYLFTSKCAILFPVRNENTFYDKFEISVPSYYTKSITWTDKTQPLYVSVGSSVYHVEIRGITKNGFVSEKIHIQAYTYNEIEQVDETEYNRIKNTP